MHFGVRAGTIDTFTKRLPRMSRPACAALNGATLVVMPPSTRGDAADRRSQYVIDKHYSPVSRGRNNYHLLGIDPDEELYTASGRPVKIITASASLIREII
jgi:hypothetical protein